MEFAKRTLLPIALLVGSALGIAAAAYYQPRLAEMFVSEFPQMIVPAAMGIAILVRTNKLEQRLNGRMDELKEGYVAKGKEAGFKEATKMAREDRKEFKEALLTPVVPPDTDPDPKKGK